MSIEQLLIILSVAIIIIVIALISSINLFASFIIYITLLPFTQANFITSFSYFDISPSYLYGLIIIVVWLSQLNIGELNKKLKGSPKIIITAFILSFIISITFSSMRVLGIKELAKHLFFITMVIVAIDLMTTELRAYYLMKWWFISICIVSGLCLLLFITDIKPLPGYRLIHEEGASFSVIEFEYEYIRMSSDVIYKNLNIGMGNNPDKLAGLSFIGIFIGIGLVRYNNKYQSILIIMISILMMELLLSFTRSAWLATIIGILWMSYNIMRRGGKKFQAVILFLALMIIPAAILFVEPLHTRFSDTFRMADASEYGRQLMWENLLNMIQQNPVKGVGPGVTLSQMGQIAFEEGLSERVETKVSAHNAILTLWAELGTLGLLSFGSLIYLGFCDRGGGSLKNTGHGAKFKVLLDSIRAALLAWIFLMSFHPEYTPWFWVLLGIAIGMGTGIKVPETDRSYAHPHYFRNFRDINYNRGYIRPKLRKIR